MKIAQLSALAAAMLLASTAQANEFIDDASLDVELQNYFLKNDYDYNLPAPTGAGDSSASQWSQAVSVQFQSGFVANLVGVDVGTHYALKLRSTDLNGSTLYQNPMLLQNENGKGQSYGKVSYALKVNLLDMGVAKYGRMFLETPLLNNNNSRSLPGLTEGFYAEGDFEGLNVYGAWATKSNHRTQSGFDYLGRGNKKEAVKVLGGGYDFGNGLNANLAAGQQDDVVKRYYFDVGYGADLERVNVNGDLVYGKNSGVGASKTAQNNSQNVFGAELGAGVGNASFGVSYQKVSQAGGNKFSHGWTAKTGGAVDEGTFFGPHSLLINDFVDSGLKSWGLHAGFDFVGIVNGLSADFSYVKGSRDSEGTGTLAESDHKEYNLSVGYDVPQVENLNVAAQYGKYSSEVKSEGLKEDIKQVRLIVTYDMSVL